jgi:predicted DNA-binding protein (MmcQ/YjbR family)
VSKKILERVRKLCLSLPETEEKEAWGAPTFRVRKKMFAMYADNHHGDGRTALWCNAEIENRDAAVEEDPQNYFVPPYVGCKGWIGVRLDRSLEWEAIAGVVSSAYKVSLPKGKQTRRARANS